MITCKTSLLPRGLSPVCARLVSIDLDARASARLSFDQQFRSLTTRNFSPQGPLKVNRALVSMDNFTRFFAQNDVILDSSSPSAPNSDFYVFVDALNVKSPQLQLISRICWSIKFYIFSFLFLLLDTKRWGIGYGCRSSRYQRQGLVGWLAWPSSTRRLQ